MYIHIIHHKKTHLRIPSTTLVLKYIFKIPNFVMGIILSQIYSICSKFSMFVGFFEIIDYIKFEANQSCILKTNKKIQDVTFIHLPNNLIVEILYAWLQFLGGLKCFHLKKNMHKNFGLNMIITLPSHTSHACTTI